MFSGRHSVDLVVIYTVGYNITYFIKIGVLYPWHETLSIQIDRLEVSKRTINKIDYYSLELRK